MAINQSGERVCAVLSPSFLWLINEFLRVRSHSFLLLRFLLSFSVFYFGICVLLECRLLLGWTLIKRQLVNRSIIIYNYLLFIPQWYQNNRVNHNFNCWAWVELEGIGNGTIYYEKLLLVTLMRSARWKWVCVCQRGGRRRGMCVSKSAAGD